MIKTTNYWKNKNKLYWWRRLYLHALPIWSHKKISHPCFSFPAYNNKLLFFTQLSKLWKTYKYIYFRCSRESVINGFNYNPLANQIGQVKYTQSDIQSRHWSHWDLVRPHIWHLTDAWPNSLSSARLQTRHGKPMFRRYLPNHGNTALTAVSCRTFM